MDTVMSKAPVNGALSVIPINLVSGYVLLEHLALKRTVEDGVATRELEGSKTLVAPSSAVEQYSKGIVKAMGPDVKYIDLESTVMYFRQQAKDKEFEVDGKHYDLINAVDIIGTI